MTSHCEDKEPYALQVLGADMEPEFPDKCVIVIEPDNRAIPESYVVAEVDGGKWFRQYRQDGERQYLFACNEIYPDIDLSGTNWRILGIIRQRNLNEKGSKRDIKHYEYPGE